MKTIPVSILVVGILLPGVCNAQTQEPPMGPPPHEKGEGPGHKRPFAEAWKNADKNHDEFISPEEFAAMPRIGNLPEEKRANLFKRLDKDADGKLSREELGRFGKPRGGPPGEPMKRLWELDTDKSGGVSFEEFKAGQVVMKLPPEKQSNVFKRLDSDGDGQITPKDRPEPPFKRPDGKPHKKQDGEVPDDEEGNREPGQINRKLDLNGDDALSFEEFRSGPAVKHLTEDQQEDRFELLDRNKDQKITAEDFK